VTLDEFQAVLRDRIPTPAEFVAFARSQGWRIDAGNGRAALKVRDRSDPLAVTFARMLGREPYRSNVLALVAGADPDPTGEPRDDAVATDPNVQPPAAWETCPGCRASVLSGARRDVWRSCRLTAASGDDPCPYRPAG
jgi:hypothetical protein